MRREIEARSIWWRRRCRSVPRRNACVELRTQCEAGRDREDRGAFNKLSEQTLVGVGYSTHKKHTSSLLFHSHAHSHNAQRVRVRVLWGSLRTQSAHRVLWGSLRTQSLSVLENLCRENGNLFAMPMVLLSVAMGRPATKASAWWSWRAAWWRCRADSLHSRGRPNADPAAFLPTRSVVSSASSAARSLGSIWRANVCDRES